MPTVNTAREQAAAIMQARLSWPQADALAADLEQAGLLRDGPSSAAALHAEFAESFADHASYHDIVQRLDDWFVKHGYPTVLYGPEFRG